MLEKLVSFAFLLLCYFLEGNKVAIFQWQAAAKTAQNFDPYLRQNPRVKYLYFNLNINYRQVLKHLPF